MEELGLDCARSLGLEKLDRFGDGRLVEGVVGAATMGGRYGAAGGMQGGQRECARNVGTKVDVAVAIKQS